MKEQSDLFRLKPIQEYISLRMGADELKMQTMEECAELIQALNKYRRYGGKGQPLGEENNSAHIVETLHEEIVDVLICIKELIFIHGIDLAELEEIERMKIERTAKRYGVKNE